MLQNLHGHASQIYHPVLTSDEAPAMHVCHSFVPPITCAQQPQSATNSNIVCTRSKGAVCEKAHSCISLDSCFSEARVGQLPLPLPHSSVTDQ